MRCGAGHLGGEGLELLELRGHLARAQLLRRLPGGEQKRAGGGGGDGWRAARCHMEPYFVWVTFVPTMCRAFLLGSMAIMEFRGGMSRGGTAGEQGSWFAVVFGHLVELGGAADRLVRGAGGIVEDACARHGAVASSSPITARLVASNATLFACAMAAGNARSDRWELGWVGAGWGEADRRGA